MLFRSNIKETKDEKIGENIKIIDEPQNSLAFSVCSEVPEIFDYLIFASDKSIEIKGYQILGICNSGPYSQVFFPKKSFNHSNNSSNYSFYFVIFTLIFGVILGIIISRFLNYF